MCHVYVCQRQHNLVASGIIMQPVASRSCAGCVDNNLAWLYPLHLLFTINLKLSICNTICMCRWRDINRLRCSALSISIMWACVCTYHQHTLSAANLCLELHTQRAWQSFWAIISSDLDKDDWRCVHNVKKLVFLLFHWILRASRRRATRTVNGIIKYISGSMMCLSTVMY
jgi:hypothetical protein